MWCSQLSDLFSSFARASTIPTDSGQPFNRYRFAMNRFFPRDVAEEDINYIVSINSSFYNAAP